MGNKEIIFDMISDSKGLTATEIANSSEYSVEHVKTYLTRLKADNKIQSTTKRGREFVYISRKEGFLSSSSVTKEAIEKLDFLNKFFKSNLNYLSENEEIVEFIMKNEDKFKDIESLVKNV